MKVGFKNLEVWKRGFSLCKKVYRITRNFPKEEKFGLVSQMRRCSSSIPANIAEGKGKGSDKDFCRFIRMSIGSSNELETFLLLSQSFGYIDDDQFDNLEFELNELRKRMISFSKILTRGPQ